MRYTKYIQLNTRLNRLEEELQNWVDLTKELSHKWMTYASHRKTGIVYDTAVIDEHIMTLHKEMEEIKGELKNADNQST